MKSIPQHCTPTKKEEKNCGIIVDPNLFRSINVLGYDSSLVGGRVQVSSSLLKTDHINT